MSARNTTAPSEIPIISYVLKRGAAGVGSGGSFGFFVSDGFGDTMDEVVGVDVRVFDVVGDVVSVSEGGYRGPKSETTEENNVEDDDNRKEEVEDNEDEPDEHCKNVEREEENEEVTFFVVVVEVVVAVLVELEVVLVVVVVVVGALLSIPGASSLNPP